MPISTSRGISRNTGPGTPVVALRNAMARKSGMRRVSGTWIDHLVIDRSRVTWSISCNEPMPEKKRGPCPPMRIIGTPPRIALAAAVTASVTPGPAVTTATPGLPVARAHPSAAWPAACSCRKSTTRIPWSRQPS